MSRSTSAFPFGLAAAALIAVATSLFVGNAIKGAAIRLDPSTRYELSYVVDGERYVADHDLTLQDCKGFVQDIVDHPELYRPAAASAGCDVQR